MTNPKHSEAVLSDLRDDWWSDDFLQLVATRFALGAVAKALDVGCGQGHWGVRLLPLLGKDATLCGVDQESAWAEAATSRAERLGFSGRATYQTGSAEALPYADRTFDLVTCQTLLMHVASPYLVLEEMLRVLKPGGRLLLSEPSNLPNQFATDSVNRELSPKQISDLAHLFFACSRGRDNLDRGDDSLGDVLPQLLLSCGVDDVGVLQNERATPLLPPYSEIEKGHLAEELSYRERSFWLWNKADAKVLFEAGRGDMDLFEELYATFLVRSELFRTQVEEGRYYRAGGSLQYLVTAMRKSA